MVTTSPRKICPGACPFKGKGCYAEGGPLRYIWDALDATEAGDTAKNGTATLHVRSHAELCEAIAVQPEGVLWRHNQAGDLPGDGNTIDAAALGEIVAANTYTHHKMTPQNAEAVKAANVDGFTINLSANNLPHADEFAALGVGPVVTVLPTDQLENTQTPGGRRVVVCPAVTRDNVSCATCGLCSRQRDAIVGFPAHGASKRRVDAIARQ
jgi:hypothetical protein